MKSIILCAIACATACCTFSQKAPSKYGDISMNDMTMTRYEKDTSAAALVLFNYGETTGQAFERHVRIKILTKDGLDWANAGIQVGKNTRVTNLKGTTYNLEQGKIVPTDMSKDGIFRETIVDGYDNKKFTLPNVKVGSVIEYTYKISGLVLPNWEFQSTIPERWNEFWAIIPDYFTFQKFMQGYLVPSDYSESNKVMTGYQAKAYHWTMKDVPAFKREPYMTSETDYISRINFALSYIKPPGGVAIEVMGSWQSLNEDLLKDDEFGKIIDQSSFLKDQSAKVTEGITDPLKKIEAIHTYVKQLMEWNGKNSILCKDLRKAVEQRTGSSADVNFMLGAMLKNAGLLVDMVLLSTREHGFVRQQYPMASQFNYVICVARVDGKPYLLDATEKDLPYTILPMRCLNGQGWMVSRLTSAWIDVTCKAKQKTVVIAELALDPQGSIKGKIQFTYDGFDAYLKRKDYRKRGESEFAKGLATNQDWQVEKSEVQNATESNLPFKQILDVSLTGAVDSPDVLYFDPFVSSRQESNPFKSEKREYPVDFGSSIEKMVMIKLTLPDNYVIDELPQSKILRLPDNSAKYTYNATQAGNIVSVTSNFQLNNSLFVQDVYPDLREFYNKVIAKQAEQIVLKKK